MHRPWFLLAISLKAVACAQIAGFEQLSPKKLAADAGAGGSVGAAGATASGGSVTPAGGESDEGGGSPASTGGSPASTGGNVNVGNNGGSAASAGDGGAAGSGGSGGTEVVGGCNAEQLRNRNFDAGASAWQHDSFSPGILEVADVILERSNPRLEGALVAPQSGNYLAWLGGVPNSQAPTRIGLLQEVTIPERVSGLVVSGWIQIRSDEPNLEDSRDLLDIALEDEDNFWPFHTWYIDAENTEWEAFEYRADNPSLLDKVRGRTLTFIVGSKTDTSYATHFWVDSLSFVAECP